MVEARLVDERFDDERLDDFDEDLPDDELITAPRFSLTTGCGQKNQSSKENTPANAGIDDSTQTLRTNYTPRAKT